MSTETDRRFAAMNPSPAGEPIDPVGANALLARVLAGPVAPRRSRPSRWLTAAAGVAAVAASVAAVAVVANDGPRSGPTDPELKLVSFTQRASGAVVARITDPDAGADQLTAAFHAEGLDIRVSAVAASPSAVGTVVYSNFDAKALTVKGCATASGGACQVGFVVPADFVGPGEAAVGRPARAGESYSTANSAFAPKEALHCSGIVGERANAPAVASVLADRGVTAEWSIRSESRGGPISSGGDEERRPAGSPAPDGYIRSATPLSAGTVLIAVGAAPPQSSIERAERVC